MNPRRPDFDPGAELRDTCTLNLPLVSSILTIKAQSLKADLALEP